MKWLIISGIAILILYFLTKSGKKKFWNSVNKHQQEAYTFFITNDCWHVIHPGEKATKPSTGEWTGPFHVIIAGIGAIKIYGKAGFFEQKQEEFMKQFE